MKDNLIKIQEKLIKSLDRLDLENCNLTEEVSRSNAVAQLANTYIKSCNLIIRVEESKKEVKSKIKELGD